MLAWSARREPSHDLNPVTVRQTGPGRGAVVRAAPAKGSWTARIAGEDAVDFSELAQEDFQVLLDECAAALGRNAAAADFVLIEGAGCIGEVPPDRDLANVRAPRLLDAPVIVVHDGRQPIDIDQARRTRATLDENNLTLHGVVVTRVATDDGDHALVQRAYDAPLLGVFPEIVDAAQWFNSRQRLEHLWEHVCSQRLTSPRMMPLIQTLDAILRRETRSV